MSHAPPSLQQGAHRRSMARLDEFSMWVALQTAAEVLQNSLTVEHSADIGDVHCIGRREQTAPNYARDVQQITRGALQDRGRDSVAFLGRLIYNFRKGGHARAWILLSIKTTAQNVDIGIAGFAKEQVMQRSRRSPLLMRAQRRTQSLTHDSPRASFVAKGVTPTAGARETAAGIASQRHRPGSGYGHDSRFGCMGAGQRDSRVVDQHQTPATKDLAENRFLAARSACKPETSRRKFYLRRRQTGLSASAMNRVSHSLDQTLPALRTAYMIRLSAGALAQNAALAVADQRPSARLAAIHAEKIACLRLSRAFMLPNRTKLPVPWLRPQ